MRPKAFVVQPVGRLMDAIFRSAPPPPAHEILEKRAYRTVRRRHRAHQAPHAASVRKKTLNQTSDHHDFSLCGTRIALGPRHSSRAMRIAIVSNLECSISALPPIPDRSRGGFLPAAGLRPAWHLWSGLRPPSMPLHAAARMTFLNCAARKRSSATAPPPFQRAARIAAKTVAPSRYQIRSRPIKGCTQAVPEIGSGQFGSGF